MIVAVTESAGGAGPHFLANGLALLRARDGRAVVLLEAEQARTGLPTEGKSGSEAAPAGPPPHSANPPDLQAAVAGSAADRYDVVIETARPDTLASHAVFKAAGRLVVLLHANHVDLDRDYSLIARLNAARMANPALRVLFVLAGSDSALSRQELLAVRAYVRHVMSASLAGTVIHEPAVFDQGAVGMQCDCDDLDASAAVELRALYREVFTR